MFKMKKNPKKWANQAPPPKFHPGQLIWHASKENVEVTQARIICVNQGFGSFQYPNIYVEGTQEDWETTYRLRCVDEEYEAPEEEIFLFMGDALNSLPGERVSFFR